MRSSCTVRADRRSPSDPAISRARPHAGGAGTAVYSAHRDTHFSFLKDVVAGDDIDVTRRDGTLYRYRITHFSVVNWDRSGIDPFADGHNLILVTCWPLEDKFPGPMRYLVHAKLVAQEPAQRSVAVTPRSATIR